MQLTFKSLLELLLLMMIRKLPEIQGFLERVPVDLVDLRHFDLLELKMMVAVAVVVMIWLRGEGVAAAHWPLQVLFDLTVDHSLILLMLMVDVLEVISVLIAGGFILAVINIKV